VEIDQVAVELVPWVSEIHTSQSECIQVLVSGPETRNDFVVVAVVIIVVEQIEKDIFDVLQQQPFRAEPNAK
jgi:hypothetical protein